MKKKIGATKDESPAQLVDTRIEELDGSGTEKSPSPFLAVLLVVQACPPA